jgi:hypothetical protein
MELQNISAEQVLSVVLKSPMVKIDRDKFLRKELYPYCVDDSVINDALVYNPAYAGVKKDIIDKIAKSVISYETNKVTAMSFATGIPGGLAMFATVPADITQYFVFMLRIMQKLAYLYGFEDFGLSEDEISDDTLNQLLVFLGVMMGVQGANAAVKALAEVATNNVAKKLAQKALMKTAIYPIVKKIAPKIGIRMTKQIFANGVSKVVPVIGGVITGGLSFITFKPCAYRLKNSFGELPICDPDNYK